MGKYSLNLSRISWNRFYGRDKSEILSNQIDRNFEIVWQYRIALDSSKETIIIRAFAYRTLV